MRTLEISKRNALTAHRQTDTGGKKLLENLFGTEIFNEKITDRIKSYEDACDESGEQPINEQEMKQRGFTDDEIAYRKLKTITHVINEGHKFNMLDTSEKKWFPVFKVDPSSPSGFVFDYSGYYYSYAHAGGASRLCFRSKEDSDYAGRTFIDLYINFIK